MMKVKQFKDTKGEQVSFHSKQKCSLKVFGKIRESIEQRARAVTGAMLAEFLQTHENVIPVLESKWKTEDCEGIYKEKIFYMSIYIYELVDEKNSFGD